MNKTHYFMSVITGFHYITFLISVVVKGKVHKKMEILPSFSQPSFCPNLCVYLFCWTIPL